MLANLLVSIIVRENRKKCSRILFVVIRRKKETGRSSTTNEIQKMVEEEFKKYYTLREIQDSCWWLIDNKAIFEYGEGIYGPRPVGFETTRILLEKAEREPEQYKKFVRGSYSPNVSIA